MEDLFQKAREMEENMGGTVSNCPFRTKYHIMPPVGWINDPNGLCQFHGVFHAYFQYSPLNVNGGGGFWGHCVSGDLLHWKYQEPPLASDCEEDRSGVYSGSSLVEGDTIYIYYTGNVKLPGDYDYIDAGRISSQILVTTKDGQHMSEKQVVLQAKDYPGNITLHVRDPKVWKEDGFYYMVLGARARAYDEDGVRKDKGCALLYGSEDKIHWTLKREINSENYFGYMWECPDIFRLSGERILSFCPQGLEPQREKFQNIYQSGYSVLTQCPDPERTFHEWDMGFDFYAPQTFESEDGRRILIGWAGVPDTEKVHRNLTVANGWQHCLTLPRELTWEDGQIYQRPVREFRQLSWEEDCCKDTGYHWDGKTVLLEVENSTEKCGKIQIGSDEDCFQVCTEGNRIELSFVNEGKISPCGGGRKVRTGFLEKTVKKLQVILDSSIVEIFVNDGEMVFTSRFYLSKEHRDLKVRNWKTCRLQVI